MGPAMGGDGHRLFNPATEKYLASRDVHFIENSVKVSNKHITDSLSPYVGTDTLSEELDGSDSDFLPDDSGSDGEEETDFMLPRISITNTVKNRGREHDLLMPHRYPSASYIPFEDSSEKDTAEEHLIRRAAP